MGFEPLDVFVCLALKNTVEFRIFFFCSRKKLLRPISMGGEIKLAAITK